MMKIAILGAISQIAGDLTVSLAGAGERHPCNFLFLRDMGMVPYLMHGRRVAVLGPDPSNARYVCVKMFDNVTIRGCYARNQ